MAQRNLSKFLFQTGAIQSFHAVIEAFHKMFKLGVDMNLVLPEFLLGLIDDFKTMDKAHKGWAYHEFLNSICRKLIKKCLKDQNLTIIEITKKVYTKEKNVHFDGQDFLYFDKTQWQIAHFLEVKNKMCCEYFSVDDLIFSKEENTLENEYWKFYLKQKNEFLGSTTKPMFEKKAELQGPIKLHEDIDRIDDEDNNEIYENVDNEDIYKDVDKVEIHEDVDHNGGQETGENDSRKERSHDHDVIETTFVIEKETILKYWKPKSHENRKFDAHLVGAEWPRRYNSVCCIVLEYNRAKKYNSRKRKDNFAKITGICTICTATHEYNIIENPFEEKEDERGIQYMPKGNMTVNVSVCGQFHHTNGEPDISKPYHKKENARGKFCKGRERELLGKRAAEIGPVPAYMEQFDKANEKELRFANKSSIRSVPVIKMAKAEEDKKVRRGTTFYESAKSARDLLSAETDSPNFPDNVAAKNLPGIVRSIQELPFKITIANFDMLKIGGTYLNKTDDSVVCLDSSGKYWQEKTRAGKNLLNSALVIPPVAAGLSPFPIFEMVSEENKTLDFVEFLQRAMGHMGTALNNTPIKEPSVIITDLSFPNIHSALNVFNKVKLEAYLVECYKSMMSNKDFPFPTKVTICESHLIPILLKAGREVVKAKMIADTCVAGLLQVLRAPSMGVALNIWEKLVLVHVSKKINQEAREYLKNMSKNELSKEMEETEIIIDFDDATPEDEIGNYGDRRTMRTRSPYFSLFYKDVSKILKENEKICDVSNELYAPEFFTYVVKQFLSLYPFITASVLEGDLLTNAHIELHWKALRAQMCKVSKAQQWPTVLLGLRHTQTRRQAKEILVHSLIPGIKYGGKRTEKEDKHTNFMDELAKQFEDQNVFKPTPTKRKKKAEGRANESYGGSQEQWKGKMKKNSSIKERHQLFNFI